MAVLIILLVVSHKRNCPGYLVGNLVADQLAHRESIACKYGYQRHSNSKLGRFCFGKVRVLVVSDILNMYEAHCDYYRHCRPTCKRLQVSLWQMMSVLESLNYNIRKY